jgi:hypothetical protein
MIKYTLICEQDHEFEGWFASAAGYDRQVEGGQVTCPVCGSAQVRKGIMTPNIATREKQTKAGGPQIPREVLDMLREVRKHVTENADYVGPRFAEEARKMHLGESEARGIYGEATVAEAKALIEEGVEVAPLPKLPEDQN